MAGAAIGAAAGPVGAIIGAFAGSIFGSIAAAALANVLTQKIFDLPKSVAVENAYRYFDLRQSCSNGEVNSAYHRLALQKHPDKGGSKEEFIELQVNLALIKKHRDDL
ncbi:unnamed protein product [Didymodactylos carnosus]|uniref:J domain-containing protein n=1 Tax=Didymodactylos carnosus TaxID=1234261 RepID=A0A816BD59_9BILA|nr:unnamed protein product [Didymodactylos carnosus]CAF1607567.1 unnamed protein product [Didymodactylos carnosus]CAF3856144.1 unnamed protein product [Didymodactylos carnosus]CAF4488276.1 unnamed protein product [Didymodactylos carnosus]